MHQEVEDSIVDQMMEYDDTPLTINVIFFFERFLEKTIVQFVSSSGSKFMFIWHCPSGQLEGIDNNVAINHSTPI